MYHEFIASAIIGEREILLTNQDKIGVSSHLDVPILKP